MDELLPKIPLVEAFIRREGDNAYKQWRNFSIVQYKDEGRDLSTNLDCEIEKRFYNLCQKHFPEFGFKGEEYPHLNSHGSNEYVWHIDPIDGTKNFAAEVPLWSVTVSLVRAGEPVFGVIYNAVTEQFYSAIKEGGAFLNGKRLHITQQNNPAMLQLALDFFMPQTKERERTAQNTLLAKLYDSFYRVRSIGSGSLSLAWLAQGHFGGYLSWGLTADKFSDVAAGIVIAQEAGAYVSIEKLGGGKSVLMVGSPQVVQCLASLVGSMNVISSEPKGAS